MGYLGVLASFTPIGMDVLRGRAPFTREQFRAVDKDIRTNHNSLVERCVAAMNKNLLTNYQPDGSGVIIRIGYVDTEVLEAALEIMHEQGGWTVKIQRYTKHTITLNFR